MAVPLGPAAPGRSSPAVTRPGWWKGLRQPGDSMASVPPAAYYHGGAGYDNWYVNQGSDPNVRADTSGDTPPVRIGSTGPSLSNWLALNTQGVNLGVGNGMQIGLRGPYAPPPPNYGDPNHLPGGMGYQPGTGRAPPADPTVTRQTQGNVGLPVGLIDPTTLPQFDPKALAALTKQVASVMNINTKGLSKAAAKQARAEVAQNVKELVRQQQMVEAQANRLAQDYLMGGKASAQLAQALPGILQSNYDTAARTLSGLAGGYAGDIQNIAQTQANQIAANPATGGGAPITSSGVNVAGMVPGGPPLLSESMRNALVGNTAAYVGTPGTAPGQGTGLLGGEFGLIGQAATLPGILQGQANQSALLAQGAGTAAAAKLLPDIKAQQAKIGPLTQSYYNTLLSGAQKNAQATATNLINLAKMYNITPYQAAQLQIGAGRANAATLKAAGATNKPERPVMVGNEKQGTFAWYPSTGERIQVLPPAPTTAKGLSNADVRQLGNKIQNDGLAGQIFQKNPALPGGGQWIDDPNNPKITLQQEIDMVMSRTNWTRPQATAFVVTNSEQYMNDFKGGQILQGALHNLNPNDPQYTGNWKP